MSSVRRSIVWFRRDLRISDHPALIAAIESSDEIIPVFILDKAQIAEAGEKLLAYMGQSLRALDESLNNCLHIIEGDFITCRLKILNHLLHTGNARISTVGEQLLKWLIFTVEEKAEHMNANSIFCKARNFCTEGELKIAVKSRNCLAPTRG